MWTSLSTLRPNLVPRLMLKRLALPPGPRAMLRQNRTTTLQHQAMEDGKGCKNRLIWRISYGWPVNIGIMIEAATLVVGTVSHYWFKFTRRKVWTTVGQPRQGDEEIKVHHVPAPETRLDYPKLEEGSNWSMSALGSAYFWCFLLPPILQ